MIPDTSDVRIAAVAVLSACLLAASPAAAAETLTLAQAAARALSSNPDLAVDAPGREAAEAELEASRAGYRPRVDLEQSYSGGNNPVYVFGTLLTQRRFTAGNFALPSLNQPDPIDNLQTRIVAQQTLWDLGRTRQRRDMAQLGVELADRGHEENIRRVLFAVVDAYHAVSLAQEAWDASRVALESAQAILTQARSRFDSGLAVEADVLRSQVVLARAREQEIQARGQHEIARSHLNRLMGAPLDAAFGETARLTPAKLPLPTEDALIAEQRQRRPDYQRLLTEVRQAELDVRARRAELLPVLGAFASWEADNPSFHDAGGTNWTAGVSFRWNIYAGGGDAARQQAARNRLEQKRRQLAALESAMALEVHQALVQCRSAEQQVDVMQAAEAQSVESLRILKNRYESGLATITDLLSAENARAAARAALANAVYRYRIGYAQVEFAAGTLSPTSTAMNP